MRTDSLQHVACVALLVWGAPSGCGLLGPTDSGSDSLGRDEFANEYTHLMCTWADECGELDTFGYSDFDCCVEIIGAGMGNRVHAECCAESMYSEEKAEECLDRWREWECGDPYTGPSECADVCGACYPAEP